MQKTTVVTPDVKLVLQFYRGMLELREFELKVQELYRAAKHKRIIIERTSAVTDFVNNSTKEG